MRFAEFLTMNGWLRLALAGMIGLAALATPAKAANVYTSNMSLPYCEMVNLPGGKLGTQNNVYVGQQVLTVNDGSSDNSSGLYTVVAWCVDFTHDVWIGGDSIICTLTALTDDHLGTTPVTSDPMSAAEADERARLVLYDNQLMRTNPSNLIPAAVQVVMGNVEYGAYYAGSDTALAAGVTLLQGIAPSRSSTGGVPLNSFTANGQSCASQSLLTDAAPGLTTTAQILEPSTVTLLGGGLLVLLMVRRKADRLIGGPRMSRQQG